MAKSRWKLEANSICKLNPNPTPHQLGRVKFAIRFLVSVSEGEAVFQGNVKLGVRDSRTGDWIQLMAAPLQSDRLVVVLPGFRGSLLGKEDKHLRHAHFFCETGFAATLLSSGFRRLNPFSLKRNLKSHATAVLEFANQQATAICGTTQPDITVLAVSANAGAACALAHQFPLIQHLVLVAPSTKDIGDENVKDGLKKFLGRTSLFVGNQDRWIGSPSARKIEQYLSENDSFRSQIVLDCDHSFAGEANQILVREAICGHQTQQLSN